MPFAYPPQPHVRRHGPIGYQDYSRFKPWLRDEFVFRCVYCLMRELFYPDGHASFGADHILPKSEHPQLECVYENLVYACNRCNYTRDERPTPDPCELAFGTHLQVQADGSIQGLTDEGRKVIETFRLDHPSRTEWRRKFLTLARELVAHPHSQALRMFALMLGFPEDLPDLSAMQPPGGNTRPGGVRDSYFARRVRGELPERY